MTPPTSSNNNTKLISFNISAPGKIILHGEHSVVYNKLALAASLDLRTNIEFKEIEQPSSSQQIQIEFTNFDFNINFDIDDISKLLLNQSVPYLEQYQFDQQHYDDVVVVVTKPEILDHAKLLIQIKEFLTNQQQFNNDNKSIEISLLSLFYLIYGIFVDVKIDLLPFSLRIRTDLSIGAGTGSSASYLVALAATLINLIKLKQPQLKHNNRKLLIDNSENFNDFELDLISRWAYCAEKIIHGTPSGIDNTICTYGSMIEFRKDATLKIIKLTKQLPLLLINTNIQRNTKLLVEHVANLYKNHPKTIGKIFDAIDELSQEASIHLKQISDCNNDQNDDIDGYYRKLMELSRINQKLLDGLNVSHPKLDRICQILNEFNLNGKLTGGGGGGYAICLIPPTFNQPEQIQQIIAKLNLIDCHTIYTNLGGDGVKIN